jgi:hypothetical protein
MVKYEKLINNKLCFASYSATKEVKLFFLSTRSIRNLRCFVMYNLKTMLKTSHLISCHMEDSCEQVLEEKDKAQFSFATSS